MPTNTNVTNLKINTLTKAQYDTAVQGGVIGANEISIITDLDDSIQVATMPTAAAGEEGKIYQYIGTTDANYTNGYFYKCVSDGQEPATYSWVQTNVQPTPSGLPDQTGHSGEFLTTDGTDASWSDKPLVNQGAYGIAVSPIKLTNTFPSHYPPVIFTSVGTIPNFSAHAGQMLIGTIAPVGGGLSGWGATVLGQSGSAKGTRTLAIGAFAQAGADGAIQLNSTGSATTNSDANTFKVATANGNYEIMSADGTIPTNRFTTTPSADGTYVPTLTISSGVATRSWAAPSGAPTVPGTMPTLAVADWTLNSNTNKYEQTVNVTGVTASNVVFVSPAPASTSDWTSSNILCITQGSGTLTFQADSVPANAVTANVVIFG